MYCLKYEEECIILIIHDWEVFERFQNLWYRSTHSCTRLFWFFLYEVVNEFLKFHLEMPTFLHQPSTSLLCHHHRRQWLSRYQPSQSFCVTVGVNLSISIIIAPLFIFNRSTWCGVPSFSPKTEGSKIGTVSCHNQFLFIYIKPIYVFNFLSGLVPLVLWQMMASRHVTHALWVMAVKDVTGKFLCSQ